MELVAKSILPLLLLSIGLLFYAVIFKVVLNGLRLTALLKQHSPQRWKEFTCAQDGYFASAEFNPSWENTRKYLNYIFSNEDSEFQTIFVYKKKIRRGFKLALLAIFSIFIEILLLCFFFIQR